MVYSKETIERFKNPKHTGTIEKPSAVGKVGNPMCGDVMWVYIKVKDNKIADIKVKTFGCVAAISTSDVVCELAKGKTLGEAEKISKDDIIKELGKLPPEKIHCSVLAQHALRDAIKKYRAKH